MERFREKFNECLREQVCSYHREKGQSKEWMAARLHVDPRSYSDQEKGEYGFSALSFLFFLMLKSDEEAVSLLHELRKLMNENEIV